MVTGSDAGSRRDLGLWVRWSGRDLRGHWVAVVAIALVLAIGMGVFAGLGSTATWRRESNDASFAALAMHDLRVTLSPGTFAAEGDLLEAARSIDTDGVIDAAAERLVVDNQLDASSDGQSILVAARVVGMDTDAAAVDILHIEAGRAPGEFDVAAAVLEQKFADHWGLAPDGTVVLAGGQPVPFVGVGMTPEDFFYQGPEGTIFSEGELAPVYMDLAQAQAVTDRAGLVNDLVLTLTADADRNAIADQLAIAIDDAGVSGVVTTGDDAYAVRVLYEDIENDQRLWNALAGLVLGAASLAAFNLISRIVEAQRREIGIGKALGVPRWQLAIRPMLIGLQTAVLGTLAGIGVGLLVGQAMEGLLKSFLPLPIWRTGFQPGTFAFAAALSLVAPLTASALPVWRAVRVEPIEAIRTGHLNAKSSRLTDWTARVSLPGSSISHMPVRNIVRTPRRTLLTVLGVAAAITALVAVLGMLDSFGRTIDEASGEYTKAGDDRVVIQLDTFYEDDSPVTASLRAAEETATIDVGLRLPVTGLSPTADDLDLLLEIVDYADAAWTPTVVSGSSTPPEEGILLARKAADDLGVTPGDVLRIRHPFRDESQRFGLVESEVVVAGTHANPLRTFAFMDAAMTGQFGLEGATNTVQAYPSDGATTADLQRAVFDLPGVASSQAVIRISESFDEALEQFVGFLFIAAVAVLLLAFLIAFNSSRISIEERRRDHATMRAFGLPTRSVLGVVLGESLLVGLAATAVGVVAGIGFLDWMLTSVTSTTLPDLSITRYVAPTTLLVALAVGLVATAAAPLLLTRRIRRMNIPDTLRVME